MTAIFHLVSTTATYSTPIGGAESCRCLPNVTDGLLLAADATVDYAATTTTNSAHSAYGIGCHAHDADTASVCQPHTLPSTSESANLQLCDNVVPRPSFCEDPPAAPDYCGYSWCYVDPLHCQMDNAHSLVFPDSDRYYSYGTCGYPDMYSGQAVRASLRGSVLRVAFMHNGVGYIGAYHPNQGHYYRDEEWFGPYVDLIQQVASTAGLVLNITAIPTYVLDTAATVTNSSSAFTHCAYAAGIGHVDICVGAFSITPERQTYARFHTIMIEDSYLIVPGHSTPWWRNVDTVFVPFTGELWLWLFVCVFVVSIILAAQELGLEGGDFEDFESFPCTPLRLMALTGRTVYLGLSGLFGGGVAHNGISAGGRITQLGFIWFFVLVGAFYTANLTNFLVTQVR